VWWGGGGGGGRSECVNCSSLLWCERMLKFLHLCVCRLHCSYEPPSFLGNETEHYIGIVCFKVMNLG